MALLNRIPSSSSSSARRRLPTLAIGSALLISASSLVLAPPVLAKASSPEPVAQAKGCRWQVTRTPGVGLSSAELHGIDASSGKDVWAVGNRDAAGKTLIEHWKHRKWVVVKSPNKSTYTDLRAVTVISRKSAWAVGWYVPSGSGKQKTLVEHWNGRSWRVVASPNPLHGNNILFGVAAASGKSVWAVGGDNLNPGVGSKPVILHWNGKKWASQKAPAGQLGLSDVAVQGKTPVAVGHIGMFGSNNPAVISYHKGKWQTVSTAVSGSGSAFYSVDAAAKGPYRAVGSQSGTSALQTLGGHGTTGPWSADATKNTSSSQINVLNGFASSSAHGGWGVGYHQSSSSVNRTLIESNTNGTWKIVSSPNPNAKGAILNDIVRAGGKDTWAVGRGTNKLNVASVLIERRHC